MKKNCKTNLLSSLSSKTSGGNGEPGGDGLLHLLVAGDGPELLLVATDGGKLVSVLYK